MVQQCASFASGTRRRSQQGPSPSICSSYKFTCSHGYFVALICDILSSYCYEVPPCLSTSYRLFTVRYFPVHVNVEIALLRWNGRHLTLQLRAQPGESTKTTERGVQLSGCIAIFLAILPRFRPPLKFWRPPWVSAISTVLRGIQKTENKAESKADFNMAAWTSRDSGSRSPPENAYNDG